MDAGETLSPELGTNQPVAPIDDSSDELLVLVLGLEVATAPAYESLVEGVLETTVSLFDHTVLLRRPRVGPAGLHSIVGKDRLVPWSLNYKEVARTDHRPPNQSSKTVLSTVHVGGTNLALQRSGPIATYGFSSATPTTIGESPNTLPSTIYY